MTPRMTNPVMLVPDALPAMMALGGALKKTRLPGAILELVHMRVSQVNGCAFCIDLHYQELKKAGESEQRMLAVAAWRESPLFSDAERAALGLAEAMTRLADRPDPVADEVWAVAARHFEGPELATLVLGIAVVNTWNRLNVATRQVAGSWTGK